MYDNAWWSPPFPRRSGRKATAEIPINLSSLRASWLAFWVDAFKTKRNVRKVKRKKSELCDTFTFYAIKSFQKRQSYVSQRLMPFRTWQVLATLPLPPSSLVILPRWTFMVWFWPKPLTVCAPARAGSWSPPRTRGSCPSAPLSSYSSPLFFAGNG